MVLIGSFLEGGQLSYLVDTGKIKTLLHNFLLGLEDQHPGASMFKLWTRSKKKMGSFEVELVEASGYFASVSRSHLAKAQQPNPHNCGPCCLLMLKGFLSTRKGRQMHPEQKKPLTGAECSSYKRLLLGEVKKLKVWTSLATLPLVYAA